MKFCINIQQIGRYIEKKKLERKLEDLIKGNMYVNNFEV